MCHKITNKMKPNKRWLERLICIIVILYILVMNRQSPKPMKRWYDVAIQTSTDKVRKHAYDVAYDKYLPQYLQQGRIKLLEIGLGCNMQYGPGASLKVWLEYFKDIQLELHFLEYDRACVIQWQPKYPGVKFHIGDQANITDLQRVIDDSGQFDVIIDDGGHSMRQQIITMEYMIPRALKAGGLFFMEDLTTSYEGDLGAYNAEKYYDYGKNRTTDLICDIIGDMHKSWYYRSKTMPRKHWLYKYLLNVDCYRGLCVMQRLPTVLSESMRAKGVGRS